MVLVGSYTGHIKLCQAFFKLRLQRNVEILDVSSHLASPGLVGMELSHNGYVSVDGLEHNEKALGEIRRAKFYRNCILGRVADMGSIPVNDGEFIAIIATTRSDHRPHLFGGCFNASYMSLLL